MSPQVDVITLGAKDLDRTRRFVEDGLRLGATTVSIEPWDVLAGRVASAPDTSGFRGYALSYIVEDAAEVDAVLASAVRAGGTLSKPTKWAFWGYSGYVTDPSGCLWKVASPKRKPLLGAKPALDPDRPPPAAKETAVTLAVADIKASKRFYADGLGWPVGKDYSKFVGFESRDGTPALSLYQWDALAKDAGVDPAGSGFRGFALTQLADAPGAVDALLDAASRAGGRVIENGGAAFADPDGYVWRVGTRAD